MKLNRKSSVRNGWGQTKLQTVCAVTDGLCDHPRIIDGLTFQLNKDCAHRRTRSTSGSMQPTAPNASKTLKHSHGTASILNVPERDASVYGRSSDGYRKVQQHGVQTQVPLVWEIRYTRKTVPRPWADFTVNSDSAKTKKKKKEKKCVPIRQRSSISPGTAPHQRSVAYCHVLHIVNGRRQLLPWQEKMHTTGFSFNFSPPFSSSTRRAHCIAKYLA